MPGWGLVDGWFRELFPEIKSDKHQRRDRDSKQKRNHRKSFRSGDRRSKYQIQADLDASDLKEQLED
jgi:hypothetical protein